MCIYIYPYSFSQANKIMTNSHFGSLEDVDDFKGTALFFFVTNANIRADGHQSSDQPGMFWRLIPWYPVQTCFKPKTAWCFVWNDHQVEEWNYVCIYIYTYVCIIDFGRTLGLIPSFCTDHHTLKWIFPLAPMLAAPLLSVFYTPFSGTSKTSRSRCLLLGGRSCRFSGPVPTSGPWPDITTFGSTWSRLPSNALEKFPRKRGNKYPHDILLAGNHHHNNEKKRKQKHKNNSNKHDQTGNFPN